MKRALLGFAVLVTSAPAAAWADAKQCIKQADEGQLARVERRLASSRESFVKCASESCPTMVRKACTEWLAEVEASLPTLLVSVEAAGAEEPSATVTVDQREIPAGRASFVDPGTHVVKVEAPGYVTIENVVVLGEGAKRTVRLRLERVRSPEPPPAPRRESVQSTQARAPRENVQFAQERGPSALTWVTGGLALVAAGSFTYFALQGRAGARDLRDRCAPSCSAAERDDVRTKYLVADVSLLAAVVFGGVSIGSLLLASPATERETTSAKR